MAKVVSISDATVRMHIENFTAQYTFPDVIKFVQDGLGNWVTSVENFEGIRYKVTREDFKQYLLDNGITTNVKSLKEALETWGLIIDYVAPIEVL